MKHTTAQYSPSKNRVIIRAKSTEFYPEYLKYLFEYLRIPQNATIVFEDKTIVGGVKKWLENQNSK